MSNTIDDSSSNANYNRQQCCAGHHQVYQGFLIFYGTYINVH